jgi:hypothetical protein
MIFLMGRHKSGASMLSLTRVLEILTYKTVCFMGHKNRQTMAVCDSSYQLAGLIEMDGTYFGDPKPGKRGRGATVCIASPTGDTTKMKAFNPVSVLLGSDKHQTLSKPTATYAVFYPDMIHYLPHESW